MKLATTLAALAALAFAVTTAQADSHSDRHDDHHGDHHAGPGGDAGKGKILFGQQCMLCHSVNAGQEGAAPSLYGVVGRKAASEPGFPSYTRALKASGLTWTPENLDKFLSGPAKLVPGTAMPITLSNPQDRANAIAYLASVKGSH